MELKMLTELLKGKIGKCQSKPKTIANWVKFPPRFLASAGLSSIIGHVEQKLLKLRVAMGLELLLTINPTSEGGGAPPYREWRLLLNGCIY